MKNKTTAAMLAFLLGGFAADRVYLNERPKRLWWLLLPPMAGVLALISAIKYLTMSEVDFGPSLQRRRERIARRASHSNSIGANCPVSEASKRGRQNSEA